MMDFVCAYQPAGVTALPRPRIYPYDVNYSIIIPCFRLFYFCGGFRRVSSYETIDYNLLLYMSMYSNPRLPHCWESNAQMSTKVPRSRVQSSERRFGHPP